MNVVTQSVGVRGISELCSNQTNCVTTSTSNSAHFTNANLPKGTRIKENNKTALHGRVFDGDNVFNDQNYQKLRFSGKNWNLILSYKQKNCRNFVSF